MLHRRDGKCLSPIDAGLVVAPRFKFTWTTPWVPMVIDPRPAEDD